ncbi:MAG TPA: DUF1549 domain-containing protein [Gemmataceae bacterium]|nr:DUF1549 domain-containing protein [Gemmataceae bacterium]
MTLRLVLAAVLSTCAATATFAAELPAADQPAEQVIDQVIDAQLAAAGVRPAPQVDDATFIRRATLDLVGRIPTPSEVDAYVKSTDPQKREKLIDRLLASPGFARHQAAMFEVMLNPDGNRRGGDALREYLTAALRENKPWDQMFRELMLPDEADAKTKGAADFLKARLTDADRLTNDVSVAFFGVNVSCAQCHDHPLVKDWTQDHFYGMKSFLARTYDAGGFVAERPAGLIKFKPNKGPERSARLMFLTGTEVKTDTLRDQTREEQQAEKLAMDKAKSSKTAPPKPAFSARAQLVEVSLQKGNSDFFSRAIVNRMWHRFFGLGLVNPLDQMHSANPPSHPELLAWLARDTAEHGYDLRRLVRGLVLSQAYSRSSRYDTASAPPAHLFAVARLKPLTPMQLSTSLRIAAADPATFEGKHDEVEKKIEQLESSARGFASLIAQPNDNFQIGVGEALLFSNGDRVMKEFLTDGPGTLLGRMKAEKDPKAAVELMVRSVFGRAPTADESKALVAYVEKRADRQAEAYRQVLWVLVTSPEFRFNY